MAASDLQDRFLPAFKERGGELQISAGKASTIPKRTKSIELAASVQWDASRIYDHVHVEVARRPWFSRRWMRMQSSTEALSEIEAQLSHWLDAAS